MLYNERINLFSGNITKGIAHRMAEERQNKRPIFLIGFKHGGTNILLNMLRSHPDTGSPVGELHQVFLGKGEGGNALTKALGRAPRMLQYTPVVLAQGQVPFSAGNWEPRRPISDWMKQYIDNWFAEDKLRAMGDSQNRYKAEGVEYTQQEVANSRLVVKNTNGDIFATDILYDMYPDATFVALVRNGYAVIEGHIRREYTLEKIAQHYQDGVQKILSDAENIPRYHVMTFEDVLNDPVGELHKLYEYCDLPMDAVSKIRMQTKPIVTASGDAKFVHGTKKKQMIWIDPSELVDFVDPSVTQNQINRLSDEQKAKIKAIAGESLEAMGYTAG